MPIIGLFLVTIFKWTAICILLPLCYYAVVTTDCFYKSVFDLQLLSLAFCVNFAGLFLCICFYEAADCKIGKLLTSILSRSNSNHWLITGQVIANNRLKRSSNLRKWLISRKALSKFEKLKNLSRSRQTLRFQAPVLWFCSSLKFYVLEFYWQTKSALFKALLTRYYHWQIAGMRLLFDRNSRCIVARPFAQTVLLPNTVIKM